MFARDLERLATGQYDGDAAVRALVDRVAAHFLTNDRKPRTGGRIHPYNAERDYPDGEAAQTSSGGRVPDRAAGRAASSGVLARPQRRALARRLADLRDRAASSTSSTLDDARVARLFRRARARGRAAAADGRVLAEPLPARGALSPRARRRVPGHEPGAVGAGARSWSSAGAKGFGAAPTPSRRRSSSSAIASSRSTASATPTSRCSTRRPRSSRRCGRTATPRQAITAASARCRRCWRSSTICSPRSSAAAADARRRVPLRRDGSVSDRRRRRRGAGAPVPRRSASPPGRRQRPALRRRRGAPRSRGCFATTTVRDRDDRRARGRAARRHRHPVPLARQPSRVRSGARAPRHPDLRLQRTRLLRRRRDQGRRRAAALPRRSDVGPARRGVPAIAVRPAVGRGAGAARRRASPTRSAAPSRPAAGAARTRTIGACSIVLRARGAATGCRGSIGCRRPSCSSSVLARDRVRLRAARAARGAGAREPEEAARPDPAHPEPRLRDARADRRSSRSAGGRRRVERRASTRSTPSA